ncbi:MAG: hypothetical protein H0W34_07200 [Pyrinomonadaceae bacterium]|jgi:hypothetical protein|nr:hypothetical protein [Pyrinomonadaceae bacterium]
MKIKIKPPAAKQLIKDIEAHLPLPVYTTTEVSRSLRQQGKEVRADEELQVTSVVDSGEMGGILCGIESQDKKEVFLISLTHLRIRSDHRLKARIEAYQKARVRSLARQR